MAEQTKKTQVCPCAAVCKFVVPILMIVFGVRALVRQLTGQASRQQEA